jgi:hypothetical protein
MIVSQQEASTLRSAWRSSLIFNIVIYYWYPFVGTCHPVRELHE